MLVLRGCGWLPGSCMPTVKPGALGRVQGLGVSG